VKTAPPAEVGGLLDAAIELHKGSRSRRATRRPIVVFPAPRRPSSATTKAARSSVGVSSVAAVVSSAREVGEPPDRNVPAPGFELHEEAPGNAGSLGDVTERPAAIEAPARARRPRARSRFGIHAV
jgi:hypothetical protein